MDHFTYFFHHIPGKELHIADTLSHAPLSSTEHDPDLEELAELLMEMHIVQLPPSKPRLEMYHHAQYSDSVRSILMEYCYQAG